MAEAPSSGEQLYHMYFNGKPYALTPQEYDTFSKQMIQLLRATAVKASAVRVQAARDYWDWFSDLNKDQYVVSWFVSLAGPKLPDEGQIKAAEAAQQNLKSAVEAGDFRGVAAMLKSAVEPVNRAYNGMMQYKEAVIGRGEAWVGGLEIVRDSSFEIVNVIATAEMGGNPGASAAAGGATELVKSAAGELGKCLAGTSKGAGAAAKNIILDGVLGGLKGGVDGLMKIKGDKIIEGVSKSVAKKIASKWVSKAATATVEKFVENRLNGAASGLLKSVVDQAIKAVKGDTTPEKFFEDVAKGVASGFALGGLDNWIASKKFPEKVYDKMNGSLRTKFFAKLDKKKAVELLDDVIKGKGAAGIQKSIEVVLGAAKGDESPEDLAGEAAESFADSGIKVLEGEIVKRVKAGA